LLELPKHSVPVGHLELEEHELVASVERCSREAHPRLAVVARLLLEAAQDLSLWSDEPVLQLLQTEAPHQTSSRTELVRDRPAPPPEVEVFRRKAAQHPHEPAE